jgi:hypothetical protein
MIILGGGRGIRTLGAGLVTCSTVFKGPADKPVTCMFAAPAPLLPRSCRERWALAMNGWPGWDTPRQSLYLYSMPAVVESWSF